MSINPYIHKTTNGISAFAIQEPVKIIHDSSGETWLLPNGDFVFKSGGEAPARVFSNGIMINGTELSSTMINVDLGSNINSEIIYKNLTNDIVSRENWFIYKDDIKVNWSGITESSILLTDIPKTETVGTYTVIDSEKMAVKQKVLENIFGNLWIEYKLNENRPLKHTLNFTASVNGQYKLCQELSGLVYDKIKTIDDDTKSTIETNIKSVKADSFDKKFSEVLPEVVEFKKDDNTVLVEITSGAKDSFQSFNYDSDLKTAKFCYGYFDLKVGEGFLIDPDTFTSNNPTEDGHIGNDNGGATCLETTFGRDTTSATMQAVVSVSGSSNCNRAYTEWDITSIPDGSDVTNTVFKFEITTTTNPRNCDYKQMSSRPSVSTASTVWFDIADGTTYVSNNSECTTTGTNKQLDLGTSADTDMKGQLSANWFAVGIKFLDETRDTLGHTVAFKTEEGVSPTPAPTLEVTYTPDIDVLVTMNHYTGNSTAYSTCNITQSNATLTATKACNSSGQATFTGLSGNQNFTVKDTNNNFVVNKTRNTTPTTNLIINATIVEVNCVQTGTASDIRIWFNQTDGHTITNFTRPACTTSNQQPIVVSWNATFSPNGKNSATFNSDLRVDIRNTTAFGKNAIRLFHNNVLNTTSYSSGIITSSDFPIGSGTATSSTLRKFYLWLDAEPDIPSGLSVSRASATQLNLAWTAGNSGVSSITGYKVYRGTDGTNFQTLVIANTGSASTSYSDTTVATDTLYHYKVAAINSYGTGNNSTSASGTATQDAAPSGGGGGGGGNVVKLPESLIGLQITENYHQTNPADIVESIIKLTWLSDKPLKIKNIDAGEFDSWITHDTTPFIVKTISVQGNNLLQPAFAAKQEGEFKVNIYIPRQFCDANLGITQNCIEEKLYNIILKLTLEFEGQEYTQNVKISLDLRPIKLSPALIQTMILGTVMIGIAFGGITYARKFVKSHLESRRKPSKTKGLGKSKFEKELAKAIS